MDDEATPEKEPLELTYLWVCCRDNKSSYYCPKTATAAAAAHTYQSLTAPPPSEGYQLANAFSA